MYPSAHETACLLAVILQRSGQTRARVSAKTIKLLARRQNLRSAFVLELIAELADRFNWILFELASGGYGAIQAKALEAARSVTAKRWLHGDERKALRRGIIDFKALQAEVVSDQGASDEDDE